MLTFNFSPFPLIETDRLLLRAFTDNDAPAYFRLRSDERVMRYIARPLATKVADVSLLIEHIKEGVAKNEAICWAITLRDTGELLGSIGYYRTQFEHFRTEIGYDLHPEYWKKGIMSEAMRAVLDYLFTATNAHSVMANIDPANQASARILERHHFLKEGLYRENYYFNGAFTDSAIYSLLKSRHLAMTRH